MTVKFFVCGKAKLVKRRLINERNPLDPPNINAIDNTFQNRSQTPFTLAQCFLDLTPFSNIGKGSNA